MRVRVVLCRAAWFLWFGYALLSSLLPTVFAEDKPLTTRYVECVRDDKGRDLASRSMQTNVVDSKRGLRAYGVVVANYSPDGGCKNTITVYLAGPSGKYRVAFQQTPQRLPDGSVYDGNGIETIQWSPSGARLLIAVSQWTWGTDSTWNTKYVLLTAPQGHARDLPVMVAIDRYFAQPCRRLITSKGWLNDVQIGIEIEPAKDVDEDAVATPNASCVSAPTRFAFDVKSGDLLK